MTIVDKAKAVLDSAAISDIDAVYTNNMTKDQADDTTQTQVLITDNGSTTESYGNNDFHSLGQEVELQIWYALKDGLDFESVELAILKAFTANGWQVSGWRRRVADPDTYQSSNTTYITRTNNV